MIQPPVSLNNGITLRDQMVDNHLLPPFPQRVMLRHYLYSSHAFI